MSMFTRTVLGFPIAVTAQRAGQDWIVTILGGCRPHVGSVSCARWAGGAVTADSLVGEGHKDHLVGERFARALAQHTGGSVSVTCGIHYESPGKDGIAAIMACTEELLTDLLNAAAPFEAQTVNQEKRGG